MRERHGRPDEPLFASIRGGKLSREAVERLVKRRSDIHYPKPRAVSLTQATEAGTVYTPDELKAIWAVAKSRGLHIHMDGARFANAVASLRVKPKEITWQAGVDVLCFGGTKNGAGSLWIVPPALILKTKQTQ